MQQLPAPATITHVDFRAAGGVGSAPTAGSPGAAPAPPHSARPLRLVTWNIERGYELSRVIELLKEADAGETGGLAGRAASRAARACRQGATRGRISSDPTHRPQRARAPHAPPPQ
jgi:hypothetical protein